MKADINE